LILFDPLDVMYTQVYINAMSRRYSIAQARANLASIVDEVETGPPVEITRRGKPVAIVLSPTEYESLKMQRVSFADAFRAFREKFDPAELGVDTNFAAALRDRDPGRKVRL
jgi:prevent-host-death family protein